MFVCAINRHRTSILCFKGNYWLRSFLATFSFDNIVWVETCNIWSWTVGVSLSLKSSCSMNCVVHFDFPLLTGEAWKEWSRVCFGFGSSLRLWERRFGKAHARAQSFYRERNPVCKCKLEDVSIIYSRDRYICCPHYHKTRSIFAFSNPIVTDDAAYEQPALLFFVRVDHSLSYKFYQ